MATLHRIGRGALAAPPIGSAAELAGWVTDREPAVLAVVLVRLLALSVGYHLLVTTALVVIGRVIRAPRLVLWADAMTLPVFRSTAARLAGLAISASTTVGGALPSAGAVPAPTASISAPAPPPAGIGHPFIERVVIPPSAPPATDGTTATLRPVLPESVPPAEPAPTVHLVVPGDHLWAIAERVLGEAIGWTPTDAEVYPFWREVIVANPDLVDPDLIFPGQVVLVPPVQRLPT
jgi:nucleoid-associated protein YgaU